MFKWRQSNVISSYCKVGKNEAITINLNSWFSLVRGILHDYVKYFKYPITQIANYNLGAAATLEPDQSEPLIVKVAPQ